MTNNDLGRTLHCGSRALVQRLLPASIGGQRMSLPTQTEKRPKSSEQLDILTSKS
jgi:hypothetical protein